MELTESEKHRAAMACRAAAVMAEKDGAQQMSPGTRETFEREARAYRELAAKFEGARGGPTA